MHLVVLLLLFMILHHVDNTYVTSSFYIEDGIIFPVEQSYHTMTVGSECACRGLCLEDQRCQNYCWKRYTAYAKCRLSSLAIGNLTPTPCTNCGIGIGITSNGFQGGDGFLYFTIKTPMTFIEAAKQCESRNGFHVGVYKTQTQLNILRSVYNMYQKETWVDMDSLANNPNAYAVWADGTPFNATEIFKMNLASLNADEAQNLPTAKFRFNGIGFLDKAASQGNFYALCQLDPSTV